jgi:toxin ParE1/3/4
MTWWKSGSTSPRRIRTLRIGCSKRSTAPCDLLADNPLLGRARPDIAPELRYLPIGNYLILYRTLPDGIEVVRVAHGARRLDSLF